MLDVNAWPIWSWVSLTTLVTILLCPGLALPVSVSVSPGITHCVNAAGVCQRIPRNNPLCERSPTTAHGCAARSDGCTGVRDGQVAGQGQRSQRLGLRRVACVRPEEEAFRAAIRIECHAGGPIAEDWETSVYARVLVRYKRKHVSGVVGRKSGAAGRRAWIACGRCTGRSAQVALRQQVAISGLVDGYRAGSPGKVVKEQDATRSEIQIVLVHSLVGIKARSEGILHGGGTRAETIGREVLGGSSAESAGRKGEIDYSVAPVLDGIEQCARRRNGILLERAVADAKIGMRNPV